jgi:ABC-2 type transport system ATP-binding protein
MLSIAKTEAPLLKIRGVSKTYPNGVRALRDITLDIPAGMFGLLGPNGAGKSTLMRTIATLQDPDTGTIEFDGIDVQHEKQRIRELLGYLPQDFGVYPKVSAYDMLDHFAVLKGFVNRGERKDVVEGLLKQVNLWDARKRKLGAFSGGMRQRFGIAQALIGKPRLVIVDEPTAGLDPEERNRFLNLLAEIGEGVAIILSTHIVEDVTDLCPRMAMIFQGELWQTGEPRDAIAWMRDHVWSKQIAKDELPAYLQKYTVLSSRLIAGHPRIHIYSESSPGDGFEAIPATLEDVYFYRLRQFQATNHASH